jgi:hypothetical protein
MRALMFLYNTLPFITQVMDNDFNLDFNLISGFLSAIDTFASSVGSDKLEEITMGNNKIIYSKIYFQDSKDVVLTLIAFTLKNENQKDLQTSLNLIKKVFFETYTLNDILHWDGNLLTFLPFKNILNDILEHGSDFVKKPEFKREEVGVSTTTTIGHDAVFPGIVSYDLSSKILSQQLTNESSLATVFELIRGDFTYAFKPDNNPNPNLTSWSVLIPLVESGRILYIYVSKLAQGEIKSLPDSSNPHLMLFTFFIPNQYLLYTSKLTSKFKNKIKQITDKVYEKLYPNPEELLQFLEESLKDSNILKETLQESNTISKETLSSFRAFNWKNIDQLIYAIIVGLPIAIIADESQMKDISEFIFMFSPHRFLVIKPFPTEIAEPNNADIVFIKENLANKYNSFVLVNFHKQSIKNSKSNKFCKILMDNLMKIEDPTKLYDAVKKEINWLMSKVSLLSEICWGAKINLRELRLLKSDLSEDAETIVLKLIEGSGTRLQNLVDLLILNIPAQKLMLDENFVKFSDSKIIVSSKLTEQQTQGYYDRLLKIGQMFLGDRILKSMIGK